MGTNNSKKLSDHFNKEKREKLIKHVKLTTIGSVIIIIIPGILFIFIKSNVWLLGIDMSMWFFVALYWIGIFQIYKYRERARRRAWQLAQFLSDRWTTEKRNEERSKVLSDYFYMNELKSEMPEIFQDDLLKIP